MPLTQPILINLSLPKCGSSSINDYCENMNSRHEAWHSGVTETYIKVLNNKYPKKAFLKYLEFRQIALGLEIDSATFHHFYAEDIINLFPSSTYIYIYRDPYKWILSMINMWSFFNDVHFHILKTGNEKEKSESKNWIKWLNIYAKVYSKSLNTYKVKEFSNKKENSEFNILINDLLDFWVLTSRNIISIKHNYQQVNIFNLNQNDEIKLFIDRVINNVATNSLREFPKSNRMKVLNREGNKPYFNMSQIKNLISKDKIYLKDKTYEELNCLKN